MTAFRRLLRDQLFSSAKALLHSGQLEKFERILMALVRLERGISAQVLKLLFSYMLVKRIRVSGALWCNLLSFLVRNGPSSMEARLIRAEVYLTALLLGDFGGCMQIASMLGSGVHSRPDSTLSYCLCLTTFIEPLLRADGNSSRISGKRFRLEDFGDLFVLQRMAAQLYIDWTSVMPEPVSADESLLQAIQEAHPDLQQRALIDYNYQAVRALAFFDKFCRRFVEAAKTHMLQPELSVSQRTTLLMLSLTLEVFHRSSLPMTTLLRHYYNRLLCIRMSDLCQTEHAAPTDRCEDITLLEADWDPMLAALSIALY